MDHPTILIDEEFHVPEAILDERVPRDGT